MRKLTTKHQRKCPHIAARRLRRWVQCTHHVCFHVSCAGLQCPDLRLAHGQVVVVVLDASSKGRHLPATSLIINSCS